MMDAIDAAQSSICLETYIYSAGGAGERLLEALVRAAGRGVRVRVLVDAFGSLSLPGSFWDPLKAAGGECRWFNPLTFSRLTFRDHRKLMVLDGTTAFVGGFNIAPEYDGDGVTRGWRDLGLRLGGPLAGQLVEAFDAMFTRAGCEHRPFTRLRHTDCRQAIRFADGELLLSGPGRTPHEIKRALLSDLARAREVSIVAAYFVPSGRLRRALLRVARRGGRVRLVLPSKSDVKLSQLATRGCYQKFLGSGVEIHEYQPQVLHTKLMVIDEVLYVGSSNLDARSLYINYELMLRMFRPDVVAEGRAIFQEHLDHCRAIDRRLWKRSRTCWNRLRERWASFVLGRLDLLLMRRQLRQYPG